MGQIGIAVPPVVGPFTPRGSIMGEDSEQSRGFRVTDRRRFSESGDEKAVEQEQESAAPEPPTEPPPNDELPAEALGTPPHAEESDAPVTFSTFILGLSTQALFHLGEIADPTTGRPEQDLPAAKQVIDILGILSEKTRNNLQEAEQSLLDSMLYDLRMRYVELVRRASKEGA
jgi:hypothetical protein